MPEASSSSHPQETIEIAEAVYTIWRHVSKFDKSLAEVVVDSGEDAKTTDASRQESVFKILNEIKQGDPNDFATIEKGIATLSTRSKEIVSQTKPELKPIAYRVKDVLAQGPLAQPGPRPELDLHDVETIRVLGGNMGTISQFLPLELIELVMDKIRNTLEFVHLKYGDQKEDYLDDYWLDCPNLGAVAATSRACSYMRYMSWEAGTMARTFDMENCANAALAFFQSLDSKYDGTQPFPKWPGLTEKTRRMHNNYLIEGRAGERSLALHLRRYLTPISCNPSRSVFFLDGFIQRNDLLRQSRDIPQGYFTDFHRFPCVMLKIDELYPELASAFEPREMGNPLGAELAQPTLPQGGVGTQPPQQRRMDLNNLSKYVEGWQRILGNLVSWQSNFECRILIGPYYPRIKDGHYTAPEKDLVEIDPNKPRATLLELITAEQWKQMDFVRKCYDFTYRAVEEEQVRQLLTQVGQNPSWLNATRLMLAPAAGDLGNPYRWLCNRGKAFFETEDGEAWLQSRPGYRFLRTHWGRQWLGSEQGRDWILSEAGKDWVSVHAHEVSKFYHSRFGRSWRETDDGKKWKRETDPEGNTVDRPRKKEVFVQQQQHPQAIGPPWAAHSVMALGLPRKLTFWKFRDGVKYAGYDGLEKDSADAVRKMRWIPRKSDERESESDFDSDSDAF
ncbi:hypothetical protein PG985_001473 [Apiospora marii]|uniref:Uncharacterized protein n=1 Tax=Apiospora marii TaxID=335849 RepID=A0ABR1RK44_9PEZI